MKSEPVKYSKMPISTMIAVWRKGCSCAGPAANPPTKYPGECEECTLGLIGAIERRALVLERIQSN